MYPYYGGNNPKLWQCNGEQNVTESNITTTFKKLTTIKEVELKLPTDQQKITFAILTSLNIVNNPQYKTWAINYLKGIDQSKESANLMKDLDLDIDTDLCILIVIEAVLTDDVPDVFVALAAHRAYYDALDVSINIDLNQIAQIVNMLDPKDIADSFE